MFKKRALYTLDEWDIAVGKQEVEEPEYNIFRPNTGIGCPHVDELDRRECGAHVWDLPFYFYQARSKRKAIGCQVCGWIGSRAIAGE